MRKGWTPERYELQRQVMKKLNQSREFKERRAEGSKKFFSDPEKVKKLREGSREKHKDPEYRERFLEAIQYYYAEYRGGYVPEHYWEEYQRLRRDGFTAKEAFRIIKEDFKK